MSYYGQQSTAPPEGAASGATYCEPGPRLTPAWRMVTIRDGEVTDHPDAYGSDQWPPEGRR